MEPGEERGRERVDAACKNDIGKALSNEVGAEPDCLGRGSACGRDRHGRTPDAELLRKPACEVVRVVIVEEARAECQSDARGTEKLEVQVCVFERIPRRKHAELVTKQRRIAVVLLVPRDHGADVRAEDSGVEAPDLGNAAFALEQGLAKTIASDAERACDAPARDMTGLAH